MIMFESHYYIYICAYYLSSVNNPMNSNSNLQSITAKKKSNSCTYLKSYMIFIYIYVYIYVFNNTYQVYSNTYNTCDGYMYIYIHHVYVVLYSINSIQSNLFTLAKSRCRARSVPGKSSAPSTIIAMKSAPHHRIGKPTGVLPALPERDLMIGYYDIVYHSLP